MIALMFLTATLTAYDPVGFAVIEYQGGPWDSRHNDPRRALALFHAFLGRETGLPAPSQVASVRADSPNLYNYPLTLLNGHDDAGLTAADQQGLRNYLISGGFLLVNDDYGMRPVIESFVQSAFPGESWIPLPATHALFAAPYDFPSGPPKVHRHDGDRAEAFALILEGRVAMLYLFSSDIVDGWEPDGIHPETTAEARLAALQFGVNVVMLALTQVPNVASTG